MAPFEIVCLVVGVGVLAVLAGVVLACHRLKPFLNTRNKKKPATTVQAVVKVLGGGGGGPIEPF